MGIVSMQWSRAQKMLQMNLRPRKKYKHNDAVMYILQATSDHLESSVAHV